VFTPFDPTLRAQNKLWTPKNSIWTSLSLDSRDIYYDPSSGYYFNERLGFYGILNNEQEHYIRSDSKAQYFHTLFNIPVTERWSFKGVLALNAGLSVIFRQPGGRSLGSNHKLPAIEEANKLAVDGMFVGRGWSEAYRDKGLLLLDTWVELRIPLVRGILAWDFFFDAAGVESMEGYYFGNNIDRKPNFTLDNMRFSFGGGLRLAMPQFPIRVSLAKRFRFDDGDFKWQPGAIFNSDKRPNSGLDLVISFILSY
jgi:outer membrane protein insertion porin family